MRVSVEYASEKIRAGLGKNKAEINFPLTFTWALKIIRALPTGLQQLLVSKLLRSNNVVADSV
jgi:hypothetical protein